MSSLINPSSHRQNQGSLYSHIPQKLPLSDIPRQPPQLSFAAATYQVSHLANVLVSIAAVHRHALMIISRYGITFYTEHRQILNIQATVDASLFSAFEYNWVSSDSHHNEDKIPKNVQLGIDVQRLSDAFSAATATITHRGKFAHFRKAGSVPSAHLESVSCYLKYRGAGYPLIVEFEDMLMSEQIEFMTYHLDIHFPFNDENSEEQRTHPAEIKPMLAIDHASLRFEIILQSQIISNLLQDLQSLGTEDLYMHVSNHPASVLEMSSDSMFFVSRGVTGYSKLTYPHARTLLQKLKVYSNGDFEYVPNTDSVLSILAFGPFIKMHRAVKFSSKCKILKDYNGVFSIQLLLRDTTANGYPSTLIVFNMLERSNIGATSHAIEVNLEGLFDDNVYSYVNDRSDGNGFKKKMNDFLEAAQNDLDEPLSYSLFIKRPNGGAGASPRSRPSVAHGDTNNNPSTLFF